jgi:hypothetical protein
VPVSIFFFLYHCFCTFLWHVFVYTLFLFFLISNMFGETVILVS